VNKYNIPKEFEGIARYSYSMLSSYSDCSWAYYLKRFLKVEDKDNIYSLLGSLTHNILEEFKNNKTNKEDMIKDFKKGFQQVLDDGFRFDTDEEKNEKMINSYKKQISHYFNNYYELDDVFDEEFENHMWCFTKNGKHAYHGFIDYSFKQKKGKATKHYIIDYKTSTMYSKNKLFSYGRQLIMYSRYLSDQKIKLKDIYIGWDFIKYAKITCIKPKIYKIPIHETQYDKLIEFGLVKSKRSKVYNFNGYEDKEVICKRNEIGLKFRATLKAILKSECYLEKDMNTIIEEVTNSNSLDCIPANIINKYSIKMKRALVEVDLTKESYKQCEEELVDVIDKIEIALDRKKDDNDYFVFEREQIEKSDSFFCSKLCGVNHGCKYYKEYKEDNELFINQEHQSDIDELRGNKNNEEDIELDLGDLILDDIIDTKINLDDEINLEDSLNDFDDEDEIDLDDLIL